MITQELLNYIKEAQKAGLNKDQIVQRLTAKGWATQDITEALGSNSVAVTGVDTKSHSNIAIFAYLGILIVIPYLVSKDDPFVKFHIDQGLILFVLEIVYWIVKIFVVSLLNLSFISTIFFFILFILNIVGIINVLRGAMTPLPIVGKLVKTKI